MAAVESDLDVARRWWDSLRTEIPPGVAGLWFGLFEAVDASGRRTRTLYVLGTSSFDPDDDTGEWAADECVWESPARYVVLPGLAALPEQPSDVPLAHAADILRRLRPWHELSGVGAAVGYDDGDLVVIHRGEDE